MAPQVFTAQHGGDSLTLRIQLPEQSEDADGYSTNALSAAFPEVLTGLLSILQGFAHLTAARPQSGLEFIQEMGRHFTDLQNFGVSLTQPRD